MTKTCETCKWEPVWMDKVVPYQSYYGGGGTSMTIQHGQCRFSTKKRVLRSMGLPQGASVAVPWIVKHSQPRNCPAWAEKE